MKTIVIGSGFSSLSAATHLAHAGYDVTVLEKNSMPGGRARTFSEQGFTYDMGPSWYWMPEIFEKYFNKFGFKISDYYQLVRLNPSYRVYFDKYDSIDVPASYTELQQLFESIEKGSASKLDQYMAEAQYKYEAGMRQFVYKPGLSFAEYLTPQVLSSSLRLDLFQSIHSHVRKYFTNPRLIKLMEFPVLFLGGHPQNTPALYSLMNYADIKLGTWYPMGGMGKIVDAMYNLAQHKGVKFCFGEEVKSIQVLDNHVVSVSTQTFQYPCDVIVSGADYHHTDTQLLHEKANYKLSYWEHKVMAPSCLIFYIGLNKKLKNAVHHTLFFDKDMYKHAQQIYNMPDWPSEPLFYVCTPSITDSSVAPIGYENMFFLMPISAGLHDNEALRHKYFDILVHRYEYITGENIKEHIIYQKSYCINDFMADYHAYKGNAYGLANTLMQTGIMKPSLKSKKLTNMYYTGQLTVPGPGVPPALISGEIAAHEIVKNHKISTYHVDII
ncbi:MAG: phytoene desaturase family protein [Cytophagales bacterium]|nr:phytoene desaturase family protein [Cytophagales bacterium]